MVAAIGPETAGERRDLGVRRSDDRFEQPLSAEAPDRVLIVVDRVDGDGSWLSQLGPAPALERQLLKARRFKLHEPGSPDPVHQRGIVSRNRRARKNENQRTPHVFHSLRTM